MLTAVDWSSCPIIEYDLDKLHGSPTIRGIRITPETVLDNFNDGLSVDEILAHFGGITEQDVRTVLDHAEKQRFLARPLR